jgi:hypothetical protein
MTADRKRLSTEVRRAIWEAWGRRCAFTGEPVKWTEMHVDHVIPLVAPDLLEELQMKGLVSDAFDINGFENLLPIHSHRNQRKSGREMETSALIWFLEQAGSKKPDIERRIANAIKSNEAIKAYLALKAASEKNDVSPEEMVKFFAHQVEGEVTLRITPGIEGAAITSANSAVAASLMDSPFSLGGGTINDVTLQSPDGQAIVCRNSNEFIQAQENGCFAYTTTEIKIASMANETTEALRAIRDSSFAENSQLREPIVTLENLDRWSAEWAIEGLMDREDVKVAGLQTIADALRAGICEIENISEYELRLIVPDGLDVVMRECMRADLDGDSWEEILVFHYVSAARAGGTLGAGAAFMAKVADDGLLYMLPYPPTPAE